MSRTFRRKNNTKDDLYWVTTEYRDVFESDCNWKRWTRVPKEGDELQRALAAYHSDAYRNFKEPGPAWYRNMFTERPQRRKAKGQLRKFMLDEEFEVMLNPKDPLEYWT